MAVIRKYCQGDIESIEFNDIGRKDWADNDDKEVLKGDDVYTIEVEGYKCVVCIEPQDNGTYYFWFTADRRISPIYVKYVRIVLDWATRRGVVWSLSRKGKRQEKLHKFLGATKKGKFERRILWVRV